MENALIHRITDCFGSLLTPISSGSFHHFTVPEETKSFLTCFGFPPNLEETLLLHFYQNDDALAISIHNHDRFLIIGDDDGTKLGIKENTGEVLSIDPEGKLPTRFVNSSILTLLAFLGMYVREQPGLAQADDEEASQIVARMRDAFSTFDAQALDNPENWWSVVLEQVEQGLL